jgi:hypothetical protein
MSDPTPRADDDAFLQEIAPKLLRAEYPEEMAERSCTCEPDAMCGAHRLLKRYGEMYAQLRKDHERFAEYRNRLTAEIAELRARLPVETETPQ